MKLDRKSRDDFNSFVLTVERALQTFLIHFFFNLSGTFGPRVHTMAAECGLCEKKSELRNSHIIPSFVYKWLKASSGTGHIRFGGAPNLRSPDGYKSYLLCTTCEGLIGSWETEFANSIFHPVNRGDAVNLKYGPWMLRFVVSVSWRVLTYFMREMDLSHFPPVLQEKAKTAVSYWRRFLLGEIPHPSRFEQHFIPFDRIERAFWGSFV